MEDPLIEVGDAIVAELEAVTTWLHPFKAERTFVPEFELGEDEQVKLEGIKVFVVPTSDVTEDESRTLESDECVVDIGAHAYVGRLAENGDELVRLTGQIKKHFRSWNKVLASGRQIQVTRRERLIAAVPQHLKQFGVMTSVVRLIVTLYDQVED